MSRYGSTRSICAVRPLLRGMARSTRIDDGRVSFIQKVPPGESGKTLPLSRLRHLASVLITGAAGIGKSTAMRMAADGSDVIAGVRTEPRLQGNHRDEPALD